MRIDFYYTAKRINSLVRPDVDESQTIVTTFNDFHLKDETDLNSPCFVVVASNLPETNYCILSNTGATAERPDKYCYFVDRIEQARKTVWHIYCTIDALATWKDSILQQSAFVVRSATQFNPYLNDDLMQSNGAFPQRNVLAVINTDFAGMNGGTYIIALAATGDSSASSGALGGMTYYACTAAGLRYICQTLFQRPIAEQISGAFGNLSSALGGLWWLPLKPEYVGGLAVSDIFIGGVTLSGFGNGAGVTNVARITRHYYDHQDAWTCNLMHFGDFRDLPPFRSYYAKIPFFGVIDIDSATISERNRVNGGTVEIRVREMIDFLSGTFTCILSADGYHLGTYTASCKVDMALTAFNPNLAGTLAGGLAKVGEIYNKQLSNKQSRMSAAFDEHTKIGAMVKGLFTGATGGAVGEKLSRVDSTFGGTVSVVGGYGGTTTIAADPELRIYERYQNTQVDPSTVAALAGRPYCGVLSLNTLSGYVLTSGFHVRGRMSTEEKQMIEDAFNNSGVFLTE